jgi:orotate phosphoribosyltransferase
MNHNLIGQILLKEKAVFLNPQKPFTWTSGIKSPIYCDNRTLISNVEARKIITQSFIDNIHDLDPNIIAGTATAGIPWASFIAFEMKLPLIYVRTQDKAHGRKNSIEGTFNKQDKVILIEDLISTGKSSLNAAEKLKSEGLDVVKVMSIFSYDLQIAQNNFAAANIAYSALCNFEELIQIAYCNNEFDKNTLEELILWKQGKKFYE